MEIKKIDWYILFAFLLIFVATVFFALYYYTYHVDKCNQDPLEFYVQKIAWEYGGAFKVYGNAYLESKDVIHQLSFGYYGKNMTTFIEEDYSKPTHYQLINLSNYYINNSI